MSELGHRFKRRLLDHWIVALVSLLVSVVLWVTVVGGEKIETTQVIQINYQLPEDFIIANQVAKELTVRVRGPRSFLSEITNQNLSYTVDLTKQQLGSTVVEINEAKLNLPIGVDLVTMNPRKLNVTLDREVFKRVPVKPILSKQLPKEYEVSTVVAQPSTVELRGSRARLNYVNFLPTEVVLLTENLLQQSFDVALNLEDMVGVKLVDGAPQVRVDVQVEGPSTRKFFSRLPIRLKTGNKSSLRQVNTKKSKIKLVPQSADLYLEGPDKVLDALRAKDIELWVYLPKLKSGRHDLDLVWKLPPNLSVVNTVKSKIQLIIP